MRAAYEINENAIREATAHLYHLVKHSPVRHRRAKEFARDIDLIARLLLINNPEGLNIVKEKK